MLLEKVREKGIDLFILIKDDMNYMYESHDFMYHADYNSYRLVFKFEDWTNIVNNGKEHMCIVGEYVNADDGVLVKWNSEDFDELLDMIKKWNDTHKIIKLK